MGFKSFLGAFWGALTVHAAMSDDVATVKYVDLDRYMGRWYEIASYPQWFEKGMSDVSAFYTLKKGYVEVINSGVKDGKLKEIKGVAKVVKASGNAKLLVSFFRPFYGDYWIIDLSPDYSWVVVSNSDRSTLWILCRDRVMDDDLYGFLLKKLSENGFDLTRITKMKINILLSGKNIKRGT